MGPSVRVDAEYLNKRLQEVGITVTQHDDEMVWTKPCRLGNKPHRHVIRGIDWVRDRSFVFDRAIAAMDNHDKCTIELGPAGRPFVPCEPPKMGPYR